MFTCFIRGPLLSLCLGHVIYALVFALVPHCGEVWTEKHKLNDGTQRKMSAKSKGRGFPPQVKPVKLHFL